MGTIIENGKYKGLDSDKKQNLIDAGGTKVGSPIIRESENGFSINAPDIDWQGYKLGNDYENGGEVSYTGDLISYIATSYSYLLDNMVTNAELEEFGQNIHIDDLENLETRTQVSLYKISDNNQSETKPYINNDNADDISYFNDGIANGQYWAKSKENSGNTGNYVWMSSYYAVYSYNNTFKRWEGPAIDPILLKGEKGDPGSPAGYYEERYCASTNKPNVPTGVEVGVDDSTWSLVPSNNDPTKYIWRTQRKVIFSSQNNRYEYTGSWSDPIQISGNTGATGAAAPQIVMVYKRTSSGTSGPAAPDINSSISTITTTVDGSQGAWAESPGNSATSYEYLWMTSAHYDHKETSGNNTLYTLTDNWTTPVCLTGEKGQDGADGMNVEFIYKLFANEPTFGNDDDNPHTWNASQTPDYLGPEGHEWEDHPEGISENHKYEYAAIRKKTNNSWSIFSEPYLWSKWGQDGIDGDGIEYISYCPEGLNEITWGDDPEQGNIHDPRNWAPSQSSGYTGPSGSEWTDDPTGVSATHRYEYTSVRKYDGSTKTWGAFSKPSVWARYAMDGQADTLKLESDNDNITIGIDSSGLVNNNYSDVIHFELYHNTATVPTNKYTLSINNGPGWITLSGNTATVTFNTNDNTFVNNKITSATVTATINNDADIDGIENNTTRSFTVTVTAVEISINDIYKIWTDRKVLQNENGNYNIGVGVQSLTSDMLIHGEHEDPAMPAYLYIVSDNNLVTNNIKSIVNPGSLQLTNVENSYTFNLYYNSTFNPQQDTIDGRGGLIETGTLLDVETVSLVTSSDVFDLVVTPNSINLNDIDYDDYSSDNDDIDFSINVLRYHNNIVENLTEDSESFSNNLEEYDLSLCLVTHYENSSHEYEINDNVISLDPIDINIYNLKSIEIKLLQNDTLLKSVTCIVVKNGLTGQNGSSPIVVEIINDCWQLAVNKEKNHILPGNNIQSSFKIYDGSNDITNSVQTLSVTATRSLISSYIEINHNAKTISFVNRGDINLEQGTLSRQVSQEFEFDFWYGSNHYTINDYISIVNIPCDGEDGETIDFIELFTDSLTIKENVLADVITYDPDTLEIQLRHVHGSEAEIISVRDAQAMFPEKNINVWYKYSGGEWTEYDGLNILHGLPINIDESVDKMIVHLYYDETAAQIANKDHNNYMDSEIVHILRDGINGVDSFTEEFIYFCPESETEIDWINNNNYNHGDVNPTTWAASDDTDYIIDPPTGWTGAWWQDHPSGINATHRYEYAAHRSYNKETGHWNQYDSIIVWSNWGREGRDGDGVEYIYRRTSSEIDTSLESIDYNPISWCNDEDYQNTEYIKGVIDENNPNRFYLNYFTTRVVDDTIDPEAENQNKEITFTIPAQVTSTNVSSVSYRVNGGTWVTTENTSSVVTITVSGLQTGDIIEWKGTAQNYCVIVSSTTYYNSNFTSTVNYEVYGNIFSLLYGDEFIDKNQIVNKKVGIFAALFFNSTTLTSAENLVLPAINLGTFSGDWSVYNNYIYYYMFRGCTNLVYPPFELPSRTVGAYCYYGMFYNCSSLVKCPTMNIEDVTGKGAMGSMFRGCSVLSQNVPESIGTDETIYRHQACIYMFYGCNELTTVPVFYGECSQDSSETGHFGGIFTLCKKLRKVDICITGSLGTGSFSRMFESCTGIRELNIYFSGDYTAAASNSHPLNVWLTSTGNGGGETRVINNYGRATLLSGSTTGVPNNWTLNTPDITVYPDIPEYPTYHAVSLADLYTFIWTDDPSGINYDYPYEYVSTRKYQLPTLEEYNKIFKEITGRDNAELSESIFTGLLDNNLTYDQIISNPIYTLMYPWITDEYVEKVIRSISLNKTAISNNEKLWMPYSQPTVWSKRGDDGEDGADGTDGDSTRTALIYTWTDDRTTAPDVPSTGEITSPWTEHPGNAPDSTHIYLWMTQGKEVNGEFVTWDTDDDSSTEDTYWTDPVCLTGPDGKNGTDGEVQEYIYRLYQTAEPFSNSNIYHYNYPHTWDPDDPNTHFNSPDYIGQDEYGYTMIQVSGLPLWTDNPTGISKKYSYEYASIRTKENGKWGAFCLPFLWSRWGEDGMDGDGIEYIFYLSSDENPVTFDSSGKNGNNPYYWTEDSNDDENGNIFEDDEYLGPNGCGWTDDPQDVSLSRRYEYVSMRKQQNGVWQSFSEPSLWARFAKDGEASAVTIDNDNENIAVIIDNQNIISSDNSIIEYSKIYMYDNLEKAEFSLLSVPSGFTSGTVDSPNKYHWNQSDKSYTVGFKFDPGQEIRDGRLSYSFTGRYVKNGTNIDRTTNIKIIGIHESDVPTLYQLRPTANIVKWTGSSYIPDTIYTYISYIENGENQLMKEYDSSKFGNGQLSLWVNNNNINNDFNNGDSLSIRSNDYLINNSSIYVELKYNNILLDSENIPCIQDGEEGAAGSSAVTLNYTNDQINLSVNEDGTINNSSAQSKLSTLNIISDDVYTIQSVSATNPSSGNLCIAGGTSAVQDTSKINVLYSTDINNNYVSFYIKTKTDCIASIPEEGYDIPFTFAIRKQGESNNISIVKTLRICGQHIPSDGQPGQNAVTYEINPSVNSIKESNGNYNPSSLSYTLIKYDGTSVSKVSTWPSGLSTRWIWIDDDTDNSMDASSSTLSPIPSTTSYINLELLSGNTVIDRETIPIVSDGNDGDSGPQGFTGPIVRYRGEYDWHYWYSDGDIYEDHYEEAVDGPRYKDIVWYDNKYYMCVNHTRWTQPADEAHTRDGISVNTGAAGFTDNNGHDIWIGSSGINPSTNDYYWKDYWEEASQFDFVATKLLYADQALVNQLSTHDLIVTNSGGYPVAGLTSGRAAMQDSNGNNIVSPLNQNLGNSWSGNTVNNDNDDPVRIFAGGIYSSSRNSYSLTYAPFRVTQSGTAYMSNAYVTGEITANALRLGSGSFWCPSSNTNITLPQLHNGETRQFIILMNNNISNTYAEVYDSGDTITLSRGAQAVVTTVNNKRRILLKANKLYQLIAVGHQWNATEITLEVPTTLYDHYDCTQDLTLFTYSPYSNFISHDTGEGQNLQNRYTAHRAWIRDNSLGVPQRIIDKTTVHGSGNDSWYEMRFNFITYLDISAVEDTISNLTPYYPLINGAICDLGELKFGGPVPEWKTEWDNSEDWTWKGNINY